jgi:hypothetical protein
MMSAEMIGWAVLAAVVAGLVYAVQCAIWPFAACGKCEGQGKFLSPSGKAWRRCRRCKGSGERVRIGRRLWTWLAARKHDAVG